MIVASIFPVVQGLEEGLSLTVAKNLEDSVRAGGSRYLATISQIWQGSKALDFADKAIKTAGLSPFSLAGKSIIYLTPILLTVLKNTTLVPEKIRPILTLFQNHLGTLYQVAAVVSSISLLFFGQAFFAVPSLLILGIGFMERNGSLSLTSRQLFHQYSDPLLIAISLVSKGVVERTFAALYALLWYTNTYLPQKNATSEGFIVQKNLSLKDVGDFFKGNLDVRINPKFIHYDPLTIGENPEIPFADKVLSCLQDERNLWMGELYQECLATIPQLGKMINCLGVHNYNLFLNLYGDGFGLRKAAADTDDIAIADPLLKWIISCTQQKHIQRKFWEDHSLDNQSQTLVNLIGTPKLPKPDFYAFWQHWIERQQIEEVDKEALTEDLGSGWLFNKKIEVAGKITSRFITLMLLDMGIAEIVPPA